LFGYVRPQKSELLVREFEEYRGVYCALCSRLGKEYGFAARLALNYDCTFYLTVLLSLAGGERLRFSRGRCAVNPLKTCVFFRGSERELSAAAAAAVLLSYFKLRDDIADSPFWKGLLYRALLPAAAHARRRAAKKHPEIDGAVSRMAEKQAEIERSGCPSVDRCAEPTAEMLAELFERPAVESCGAGSPRARVLRQFGYYLGRWTYLMDAADDLAGDLRSGAFNPFARRFSLNGASAPEEVAAARRYAERALNATLARLGAAGNLLDFENRLGPVVQNVVFKGLPQVQQERLSEKERRNVRPL
jgi:hypothetical protein